MRKHMSQEYVDKLKSLNLPMDTVVTLTYSDGCDVFLHNETEVEDALRNTDVVSRFCDLVFQLGGETQQSVLDELVDACVIDDPDDADDETDPIDAESLSEAISEDFHSQDLIEFSVKKYDYKRGFCTLTSQLQVKLEDLLSSSPDLSGWEIELKTPVGMLQIEG